MGERYLKLRTVVIVAVIAVFAFSMFPLTPRDFFETFRRSLKRADDPAAAKLVEDARLRQQAEPGLNPAAALLEAAEAARIEQAILNDAEVYFR